MRRTLLALVLTGCGGILPFFGDDDDDDAPPSPPVVVDGASDATSAEGATGESDARPDATRDADARRLVWSCTTQPSARAYDLEEGCNGARLGEICDPNNEPPIDQSCEPFGTEQTYCAQVCQKTDGAGYSYTLTKCTCAAQP